MTDLHVPPPKSLQTVITAIVAGGRWSDPIPLERQQLKAIPPQAGIYEVIFAPKEGVLPPALEGLLGYVGQTGNLHQRLGSLLSSLADPVLMPFKDPHCAAPCLWTLLRLYEQVHLEVRFFLLLEKEGYSAYWRQGIEDLHLAVLRQRATARAPQLPSEWFSPLANYGYIPSGWRSSSNRKTGRRGRMLEPEEMESEVERSKHGSDVPPRTRALLDQQEGKTPSLVKDPFSLSWGGYLWSPWQTAASVARNKTPPGKGLYRLARPDSRVLLLVGSGKIEQAARKAAPLDSALLISSVSGLCGEAQLLAQLSDLCGLHLWNEHALPLLQYGGPIQDTWMQRVRESLFQPPLWSS